jgi:hypothetical protein
MIRNCLHLIVIAALSVSPLRAQSPNSPEASKRASGKVLPLKGTTKANSCAAYGPGFVKVEGTDTCVQIGGSIGVGGSVTGRR